MSQPSLGLGRPRHEDTESAFTRGLDARKPEVDFPIPASPSSTSATGPSAGRVEERVDGVELRIPADDVDGHGQPTLNRRLDYRN